MEAWREGADLGDRELPVVDSVPTLGAFVLHTSFILH